MGENVSFYVVGVHSALGVPTVVREFILSGAALEVLRKYRAEAERRPPRRKKGWSSGGRAILMDGDVYGLLAGSLAKTGAKIVDHENVVLPMPMDEGFTLRPDGVKGGKMPVSRKSGLEFMPLDPVAAKLEMQSSGDGGDMHDTHRGQPPSRADGHKWPKPDGEFVIDVFSGKWKVKIGGVPLEIPESWRTWTDPQGTGPFDASPDAPDPKGTGPFDDMPGLPGPPIELILPLDWMRDRADGAVEWFKGVGQPILEDLGNWFGSPPPEPTGGAEEPPTNDGSGSTGGDSPGENDDSSGDGDDSDDTDTDSDDTDAGSGADTGGDSGDGADIPGDPQGDRTPAPTGEAADEFLAWLRRFMPILGDPDPRTDGDGAYVGFISDEIVAEIIGPWGSLDPWILTDPTKEPRSGEMIEVELLTIDELRTDPPKEPMALVATFAQKMTRSRARIATAPNAGAAFAFQTAIVAHRARLFRAQDETRTPVKKP